MQRITETKNNVWYRIESSSHPFGRRGHNLQILKCKTKSLTRLANCSLILIKYIADTLI